MVIGTIFMFNVALWGKFSITLSCCGVFKPIPVKATFKMLSDSLKMDALLDGIVLVQLSSSAGRAVELSGAGVNVVASLSNTTLNCLSQRPETQAPLFLSASTTRTPGEISYPISREILSSLESRSLHRLCLATCYHIP